MQKYSKRYKGFGILEVLLAGVVIITMLGALVVLGKTVLNNLAASAQRAQATFLAQQGMELVREIRDTNYIDRANGTVWNTLVSGDNGLTFVVPGYLVADSTNRYVIAYNSNSTVNRSFLKKISVPTDGIITVDNTDYMRVITFKSVDNLGVTSATSDKTNVLSVTSLVTWGNGKSVKIDEMITNSRPNF